LYCDDSNLIILYPVDDFCVLKKFLTDVLTPNQFSTLKIVFLFGLIKLISSYQNLKSATSNFEILRALNQNQIYLYSVKITNLTKQTATDALLL